MTVYQGKKPPQSACKYEFGSLPHHELIQRIYLFIWLQHCTVLSHFTDQPLSINSVRLKILECLHNKT